MGLSLQANSSSAALELFTYQVHDFSLECSQHLPLFLTIQWGTNHEDGGSVV